jgi:hypothetical protein
MYRFWLAGTHSSRNLPDAGASSSQKTTMHMRVTSKRRVSMVNSRRGGPVFSYIYVLKTIRTTPIRVRATPGLEPNAEESARRGEGEGCDVPGGNLISKQRDCCVDSGGYESYHGGRDVYCRVAIILGFKGVMPKAR